MAIAVRQPTPSEFLNAPRGLLKMFVLKATSKMPLSGTEILHQIAASTRNVWKPSPGSIYFLLSELSSLGLITELHDTTSNIKRYIITEQGREALSSFLEASDQILRRQLAFARMTAQLLDDEVMDAFFALAEETPTSDDRKIKALRDFILKMKAEARKG